MTSKIIMLLTFLLTSLALYAKTDNTDLLKGSYPKQVKVNEIVSFGPAEGNHFNLDAPIKCEKVISTSETEIKCQFNSAGEKSVSFFVCDDAKTYYCKVIRLSISVYEENASLTEEKNFKDNESIISENSSKKQVTIPSDLSGAVINLFTDPKNCSACDYLEKDLTKSGEEKTVTIIHNGNELVLPIVKYNPWENNTDPEEMVKLGYPNEGIPAYAIVLGDKIVAQGYAYGDATKGHFDTSDKNSLEPKDNESAEEYGNRMNDKYKTDEYSFSKQITYDLYPEMIEKEIKTISLDQANPRFSPKLDKVNVLIAGTSFLPLDNPLFTGHTIKNIDSIMETTYHEDPVILYGFGDSNSRESYMVERKDPSDYQGEYKLKKVEGIKADQSFDRSNLKKHPI